MNLQNQLVAVAKKISANYTFKGRPLSYDEVFSSEGVLPGLTKRADQLASLCLGYGLGASYESSDQTLLGHRVSFDKFTPDTLRLFCIIDVLYDIINMSNSMDNVSLDELMYD